MQNNKVLVTGGCGYIGSHTLLELLEADYKVVVLDSLINSSLVALKKVQEISGVEIPFVEGDVRNTDLVIDVLKRHKIDAVIHFAGVKAVAESLQNPTNYYDVNVGGTISLIRAMELVGVSKFIFSSSATVYGEGANVPYIESMGRGNYTSPYGCSKGVVEKILEDKCRSKPDWEVSILRYFNPIGAHKSGLIGENPTGTPNNLMPFITQVAVGIRDELSVFGGDYNTPDGTCRRDYIHVVDLASGHVRALQKVKKGCHTYNLGTGKPVSVFEMISCFEFVTGISIQFKVVDRRLGDLPEFWADNNKARKYLKWKPKFTLKDMVADSWRWQKLNPCGFEGQS